MIPTREDWFSHLFSSEPANRDEAESALRDMYAASGLPAPRYFFWFDSPFKTVFAMMLLAAVKDSFMRTLAAALERTTSERKLLDVVRGEMLGAASQPDWNALAGLTGESLFSGRTISGPIPAKSVLGEVTVTRLKLYPNVADAVSYFSETDPLQRAERSWQEVMSGQSRWGAINPLLNTSFYRHYTYAAMAADEAAANGGRRLPPLRRPGAWRARRAHGGPSRTPSSFPTARRNSI